MGYFGIKTRGNKIAWSLIAVFLILGIALWIPGMLQYKRCLNQYAACVCKGRGTLAAPVCLDPLVEADRPKIVECLVQEHRCRRAPVVIWALGWLFLAGFSWLPCFYFCCCAKNPAHNPQGIMYQQNGVQMATGYPYGPDSHYTTHAFAPQPYGPMPYYGSPQQQCPAPMAQTPAGYPGRPQQQQQQSSHFNAPVNSY